MTDNTTRPLTAEHPRTYSLVGTPHLFLVTDDESGITIGYADRIGGPLVAPPLDASRPSDGLRAALRGNTRALHETANDNPSRVSNAHPAVSWENCPGYACVKARAALATPADAGEGLDGRWRYDEKCEVTPEDHERGVACQPLLPHSHRHGTIKWARWFQWR